MAHDRTTAAHEFWRVMLLVAVIAIVTVIGALWALSVNGPLTVHMIVATILGVFFSVLLGCGLFAAAFFSDKSGHDQNVTDATRQRDKG